jgi:hypothetical protein
MKKAAREYGYVQADETPEQDALAAEYGAIEAEGGTAVLIKAMTMCGDQNGCFFSWGYDRIGRLSTG